MKTPRLKQIRKMVKRLSRTGYRTPYNILADHGFLVSFHTSQMSPRVIEHILDGQIKLWTTLCEYKRFKEKITDKRLISHVAIKKCAHTDFRTLECLSECIGPTNESHYFLAVSPQYRRLKDEKKTPIIFMHAGVLSVEVGKACEENLKQKEVPEGLSEKEKALLEKMFK
ncbi:U3 small nucleolar RNA-associated protein 23 [Nematocida sp. AWRm80]|nr:U3 small nucleolar RNA-associated protein 23 [Nematocida sp. AWRm80]